MPLIDRRKSLQRSYFGRDSVFWLCLCVFAITGSGGVTGAATDSVNALTAEQAAEYKLDTSFYTKCTVVQDILIASSDRVSDHAHRETAYQFDMVMKSIAPPVAQRIRDRKVLCLLIGHDEFTSDLPQFKTDKTGKELDFYNWRQRGFLTNKFGRPTVVFAEEDVLEFEGGVQLESILIHEFGHVIHGAGFDQALQDRLTEAFEHARASGIWNDGRAAQRFRRVKSLQPVRLLDALVKSFPDQPPELLRKCLDGGDILVNGQQANSRVKVTKRDQVLIMFGGPKECYAHKNRAEYWAEGVQCWYDTNRTKDHDHNHIHTRDGLKAYDPPLAKLCEDVLGDSEWRFISPRQRAGQDHLQGFDPNKSPVVVHPEHTENAANDYYDTYWKDYWQRLRDKYALLPKLTAEGTAELAKAAREKGNAVRGAVLFPQTKFGCTNCHATESRKLLGPDLTKMDAEATDAYLVESILEPSKVVKKGFELVNVVTSDGKILSGRIIDQDATRLVLHDSVETDRQLTLAKTDIDEIQPSTKSSMPDGLVEQCADRQEFLDLVRYMMELRDGGQSLDASPFQHVAGGDTLDDELRGLVLLDDLNCLACHEADSAANPFPPKLAPKLAWAGGRINPQYIERFIADPAKVKPGTTMPNLMASMDADARTAGTTAITHYINSLGKKPFAPQDFDPAAAERGRELFHSVGCVACHSPRNDDGSELLPQNSVALGKLEAKYNLDGLAAFLEDPLVVRPSGRMPKMQLSHWEALDVAHYLLQETKGVAEPFEVDPGLAEEGKRQFHELGCVQCHRIDANRKQKYPRLTSERLDQGCLSGTVGSWPTYSLDESDRGAIRAALNRGAEPLTDHQQISVTLTTFNCVACHQRDSLGGVSLARDEYFQTTNQNLGQQGRIPPPLTGVGAKLKPVWMRDVLVSGRTIRPYMKTRMPQFGADNVAHLIPLFQRSDKLPVVEFATFKDQKEMKDAGHELVGDGGLNCVACHTFQQMPAQTMPAVDLTEMAERLHKDWFVHYIRAPQQLSQNTVMPTFWPGGRAMRKDILAGDADLQIEALWQYLLDGRQARTPRGLISEPIELLATDEAVMLRRSYNGIGKRGIGVGYPGQVNLAFDAEQMRLAMIWKGKFAETSGVWRSQGHGTVRPLGGDLIQFPRGPELDDATNPWVVDEGRPPQHQFKGYDLDDLQRPTFRYRFDNVEVEDYAIDVKDARSGGVLIQRTLTFTSDEGRRNVAFRVAADKQIVSEGSGVFRVGKVLRIHIDDQHEGQIVETADGKRLRIPLDVAKGKSTLVLEYIW